MSVDVETEFWEALSAVDDASFDRLCESASRGIPDFIGLRPWVWKVLLNYLPCNEPIGRFERILEKLRGNYCDLVKEVLPSSEGILELVEAEITGETKDETLRVIIRDVERTLANLQFFAASQQEESAGKKYSTKQEAMIRMLYVFAKLHPGIKYVQGMNEVLAPIYACFSCDLMKNYPLPTCMDVEADSFFCFTNLIAEIHDRFSVASDKSNKGISALMNELGLRLKEVDFVLWQHLV
jgi:hypothetical protein